MKTYLSDIFQRQNLIQPGQHSITAVLFMFSLTILPLGFMTLKGLFGILAAICLILALVVLASTPKSSQSFFKESNSSLIIFSLSALSLSILISQLLRDQFSLDNFDGPTRLILGIPVLIAIYKLKIDFAKLLSYSLPLALLLIFTYAKLGSHAYGDRLTNNYLDPIIWGNYSIIIGFICFASIQDQDSIILKIYKLFGFGLGVLMSLLSQSRTGWVAAIVLMIVWIILNRKHLTFKKIVFYLTLTVITLLILYLTINTFQSRIDAAVNEVLQWQNKTATETATGIRLTMWKMTLHLFSLSPWIGYGEYSALPVTNDAYILSFADPESIKTILCCGPHNEMAAHMLQSGIIGIIALISTYLVPAFIFSQAKDQQSRMMGVFLCVGIFICGLGTEMLGLKVTYTFYSLLLSGLLATTLWKRYE